MLVVLGYEGRWIDKAGVSFLNLPVVSLATLSIVDMNHAAADPSAAPQFSITV